MNDRHLSLDGFGEYLLAGVPAELPINGTPPMSIFITPAPGPPSIGLRIPEETAAGLKTTGRRHLSLRRVYVNGGRFAELVVDDHRLFLDAYPILLAIADGVQLQGRDLSDSVADTMQRLGRLLERHERFPTECEVGLFGELLFLTGLCVDLGAEQALAAWLGPAGEQHDFATGDLDIEVKTTRSDHRAHHIGSPGQLHPIPGRSLWLASYQLTRAGSGGGSSLPELIRHVTESLDTPARLRALTSALNRAGWRDDFARTTTTKWRLRTEPVAYLVDDDFPRVTTDLLGKAGVDLARVSDLSYTVDLSGLPPGTPPPAISNALIKGVHP